MTSKTVVSADGATISYRQVGSTHPGLIVVHGGMETWLSHRELAEELSDAFTVYLPDRRGRGASSPSGPAYSMQTEVDDIAALARATGAHFLFGISSGALITLQCCVMLPGTFQKAAVYEPPLALDPARLDRLTAQFNGEVERDDIAAALLTGMDLTEMAPTLIRLLPRWLEKPVINWFLAREEGRAAGGDDDEKRPPVRPLVPTMAYDFALVKEMQGSAGTFAGLRGAEILLLSGTASRPFLIRSVEELEKTIPGAKHIRFRGLDHLGSGNKDTGGRPKIVADALKAFFVGGRN